MSEIVAFRGKQVAAAFRHLDPARSLGEGITAGGFPVIGYRGKAWSLRYQGQKYPFVREDDGSPLTYLDVIIVGNSPYVSKLYYPPGEFDEDSSGAPICAAVRGDVPDPGVPEPQSKTCATCKNNAWTTLPNGKKGKPCQDHKRLAVILMPKVTAKMLGAPLGEPAYLKVPPGSLASLKSYGDSLSHQGFPAAAVITRVSFAPNQLFQMSFEGKQVLTDNEAHLVLPFIDDARTRRITGETTEISEVRAAPPPMQKKEERIETGLADAFGTQEIIPPKKNGTAPAEAAGEAPRRGRGRPPKAATPTMVVDNTPPQQAVAAAEPQQAGEWGEAGSELDAEVENLLSQKVSDMLK